MKSLRFSAMLLVGLALVACATAPTTSQPVTSSSEIVIGVAGPMSGELSEFGAQLKRGAEQAVADINAGGGVLGKKLRLEVGDDACDPKRAPVVADDLVSRGVIFVDGHFCSGSSIPASSTYHDAGVLQITPASSNPRLTDDAAAQGWGTVFRVCGRDDRQGDYAGSWLAQRFKGGRVGIVHDDSVYGRMIATATKSAMNAGGLQEVLFESITAGERDFGDVVAKLKDAGIDALYFAGYHSEAGLLVRQMREQGVQAQMFGPDSLNTLEFAQLAGAASDGVMFTSDGDARKQPSAQRVVAALRQRGFEPEGYTLYSYVAIQLWAQAAAKAASTDAGKLAAQLRSQSWDTAIGPISFDAKGDRMDQPYVWYIFKNGRYGEAGV